MGFEDTSELRQPTERDSEAAGRIGAEGEGGVRGWVADGEGEAERKQQQRQRWRRSQVQQEAALGGAGGEPAALVEGRHRRGCKQWRYRKDGRSG